MGIANSLEFVRGKRFSKPYSHGICGIQSAMDIAKCLALGANLVGMAGEVLRQYHDGTDLDKWLEEVKLNLRKIMLLTGSTAPEDLNHCRKILKGDLGKYEACSRS